MNRDELSRDELEVVFGAWLASRNGQGVVITDDAYPAAHALAERGWLRREFTADGELAWFWAKQGDAALRLSGLMHSADSRRN